MAGWHCDPCAFDDSLFFELLKQPRVFAPRFQKRVIYVRQETTINQTHRENRDLLAVLWIAKDQRRRSVGAVSVPPHFARVIVAQNVECDPHNPSAPELSVVTIPLVPTLAPPVDFTQPRSVSRSSSASTI